MRDLHLEETGEELPRGYRVADNDEDSVDMDELSKQEDTSIEEDADPEPDSELKSTDDEEIEEVESTDGDDD